MKAALIELFVRLAPDDEGSVFRAIRRERQARARAVRAAVEHAREQRCQLR